ncbi:MAG: DUF2188 domain-containing protein [Chitinophagaceae bacterium]|nr:DUF2188 domain-containing protein [Chitinophagaceae bacterium]
MIKNPLYTRKLGNKVARAAIIKNENVLHIIYGGVDTWKVIREGQERSLKNFPRQSQAIVFAKSRARKKMGEIVVHRPDGWIKDRISFAQ